MLAESLTDVADFLVGENLDGLKQHLDPKWIEEALEATGTTTIRRRRLPAEQIIWLVIGMGLFRNESIERVVDMMGIALPDRIDSKLAKSAIPQARRRLAEDPLAHLFATTADAWATKSADAHRWRGLALYGMDGTTLRVPDSPENRATFGGTHTHRGGSGYPLVRIVAMMALRSHILSSFRVADFATGETTLARDMWREVPANSLVLVDRGFLVKKELYNLETTGGRHWLSRSKKNTTWAVIERLGPNDALVEWKCKQQGMPAAWQMRAITYKYRNHEQVTLLTSLTDAKKYPAKELIALYHERWETELGYDEIKTHLLDRQEAIRSRTPEGVRQELWGIAIAYNLIRVEMEKTAEELNVPPTRISFVNSLWQIRETLRSLTGPRLALGTIPDRLERMRANLKRLVLPERRVERSYPRAVKVKMSNYPRKRPTKKAAK